MVSVVPRRRVLVLITFSVFFFLRHAAWKNKYFISYFSATIEISNNFVMFFILLSIKQAILQIISYQHAPTE